MARRRGTQRPIQAQEGVSQGQATQETKERGVAGSSRVEVGSGQRGVRVCQASPAGRVFIECLRHDQGRLALFDRSRAEARYFPKDRPPWASHKRTWSDT